MADILNAGGTTTSLTNTPQAGDDTYNYLEDLLYSDSTLYNQLTNTLTIDVMKNDLGGKAKSLFSISDVDGTPIDDLTACDLLTNSKNSLWEQTTQGNWIRIWNGKVEYRLNDGTNPNTNPGAGLDINSIAGGTTLHDTFVYAIKLGNGTLSWATVTINIAGANDDATISGQTSGGVIEDAATTSFSGDLNVNDIDSGEARFQAPASGSLTGTYGDFVFNAETGGWTFTLDNSRTAVQALAAGQTATQSLTVTSLDGTDSETVTITITGTNDGPVVAAADVTGAVLELGTASGNLTDTGTIAFTDVDLLDVHSVGAVTASAGALGTLAASVTTDTTGTGLGGVVTWNYSVAASAVEYLAAGETRIETFTFSISDGHGGSVARTVSVTITGTNDGPVLSAGGDVLGGVTETAGTPEADAALTDSGSFDFTDVDTKDVAQVGVVLKSVDGATDSTALAFALGELIASISGDTDATNGGTVIWNYAVSSADVEFLAAGQTRTLVYTLTVSDGNGGTVSRDVTITITGTNDGPVVAAADVTGAVSELGAASGNLTDTGMIAFTDVDLLDVHSVGAVTASPDALGTLAASVTTDTTGTGLGGVVTWNYSVAASAVEYLAAGETRIETFTFSISDGHGGSVARTVSVTITGTNDGPVLTAGGSDSGAITETAGTPAPGAADLGASGSFGFTDVDTRDVASVSSVLKSVNGASDAGALALAVGSLTAAISGDTNATNGGSVDWSYAVDPDLIEGLAKDQTLVLVFTLTVSDGNGGTVSRDVTITITGTNDAAIITGNTSAAATEAGGGDNTAAGVDPSGDLDSTDVDGVDDAWNPVGPTVTASGYGSFAINAAGQWTYIVNQTNPDVQALAPGATLSDSFRVTTADGTPQVVNVTINGANDAPKMLGDMAATVAEGGSFVVTAELVGHSDPDDIAADALYTVSAVTDGEIRVNGVVQATFTGAQLAAGLVTFVHGGGEAAEASFDLTVEDGNEDGSVPTPTTFFITVTPVNDAAVISGTLSGSVTEDAAPLPTSVSGDLFADDADNPDDVWAAASGTTAHGSWTVSTSGVWVFTLDNTNPAVQALNAASTPLTDTFTVYSADRTSQVVSITINGANEPVTTVTKLDAVTTGADENDFDTFTGGILFSDIKNDGPLSDANVLRGTSSGETIEGKANNDILYGLAGNDRLLGGSDTDVIYGGSGDDHIEGGSHVDTIYGGSGNDTISGDADLDAIYGGLGGDILTGNAGADTFWFTKETDRGDTITDFLNSDLDKLNLAGIDADKSDGDNDTFAWGGTTAQANGLWYAYNATTNVTTLYGDTDGNVATAEFWVDLSGNVDLQAAYIANNIVL